MRMHVYIQKIELISVPVLISLADPEKCGQIKYTKHLGPIYFLRLSILYC